MAVQIKRLCEHTINQIAAGEVIENPASVLKELMENSLDAGATKIVVEIEGGGLLRILVADNGKGMGKEDALLCLERHATSKICETKDLFCVATMGFRGEALASIASISKMTLQTAQGEGLGSEVIVEGWKVLEVNPFARNQGTTIEVRQIFYNVPARRKFQKSPAACSTEITKLFVFLSLANPFVTFELYQDGKLAYRFVKEGEVFFSSLILRIGQTLGEEFSLQSTKIDFSCPFFSCKGIVGSVENTRPNRSSQYVFINKRPLICPMVSFAVKDAFGTRIPEGRFPVFVLHIDMEKELLDVNVHPQKKEVRLQEEPRLKFFLQKGIEEALTGRQIEEIQAPMPMFADKPFFQEPDPFLKQPLCSIADLPHFVMPEFPIEKRPVPIGLYGHYLWLEGDSISLPEGKGKEVVLVDLRAAGARVLFESLQKTSGGSDAQGLLFPLTWACSLEEKERIQGSLEELSFLGFSLEEGRSGYLVNAIPSMLQESEALLFLQDFIRTEEKGGGVDLVRQRRLATVAARTCAKRERHNMQTALALLEALLKSSFPYSCPLGKKILIFLEEKDLEQLFTRKSG